MCWKPSCIQTTEENIRPPQGCLGDFGDWFIWPFKGVNWGVKPFYLVHFVQPKKRKMFFISFSMLFDDFLTPENLPQTSQKPSQNLSKTSPKPPPNLPKTPPNLPQNHPKKQPKKEKKDAQRPLGLKMV